MNRTLTTLLAAATFGLTALAPAHATSPAEKREAMREKMQDMTPEEKAAAKEKAKAKWDAMTPEQQAQAKKRFADKHPKAAAKAKEKAASAAN